MVLGCYSRKKKKLIWRWNSTWNNTVLFASKLRENQTKVVLTAAWLSWQERVFEVTPWHRRGNKVHLWEGNQSGKQKSAQADAVQPSQAVLLCTCCFLHLNSRPKRLLFPDVPLYWSSSLSLMNWSHWTQKINPEARTDRTRPRSETPAAEDRIHQRFPLCLKQLNNSVYKTHSLIISITTAAPEM